MKEDSVRNSRDFALQRFITAQNDVYEKAVEELLAGQKRSHWMWFIFPQLHGLGESPMARKFAISGREEAEAYIEHPILGDRLYECSRLVIQIDGASIQQIFGFPDYLKFRSCMTLFGEVHGAENVFNAALKKYFSGDRDEKTLKLLAEQSN